MDKNSNMESKPLAEGSILIPKISLSNTEDRKINSSIPIPKKNKKKKLIKSIAIVVGILLFVTIILGTLFFRVYKSALKVQDSITNLNLAVDKQDLPLLKNELNNTKKSLQDFKGSYKAISWMKFIPFVGLFIADGEHAINAGYYGMEAGELVVDAVEPYADIIGFTSDSNQSQSGEETTQDRLDLNLK